MRFVDAESLGQINLLQSPLVPKEFAEMVPPLNDTYVWFGDGYAPTVLCDFYDQRGRDINFMFKTIMTFDETWSLIRNEIGN